MLDLRLRVAAVLSWLVIVANCSTSAHAALVLEDSFNYASTGQLVSAGWQGQVNFPSFTDVFEFTGTASGWISGDVNMRPATLAGQTLMRLNNAATVRGLGVTLTEDFSITAHVAINAYSRSLQFGLGDATGAGYSLQWNASSPTSFMGNGFFAIFAQSGWNVPSPNETSQSGTAQLTNPTQSLTPPTGYPLPASVVNPLPYTPTDAFLGYTEVRFTWNKEDGMLNAYQNGELVVSAQDFGLYSSFDRLYFGGGTVSHVDYILVETTQTVLPGDYDGDDDVDGRDFLMWQRGQSPASLTKGDLAAWQNNFGTSGGTGGLSSHSEASSIPEPGAASIAVMLVVLQILFGARLRYECSSLALMFQPQ